MQKPPGDDFGAFYTGAGGKDHRFRSAVPTSYDFEGRLAGAMESFIPYSSGGQRYVSAAPLYPRAPRPELIAVGPPPGYIPPPHPTIPSHPLLGEGMRLRPPAPRPGGKPSSSDPPKL